MNVKQNKLIANMVSYLLQSALFSQKAAKGRQKTHFSTHFTTLFLLLVAGSHSYCALSAFIFRAMAQASQHPVNPLVPAIIPPRDAIRSFSKFAAKTVCTF